MDHKRAGVSEAVGAPTVDTDQRRLRTERHIEAVR
jgi:hypothetical protein